MTSSTSPRESALPLAPNGDRIEDLPGWDPVRGVLVLDHSPHRPQRRAVRVTTGSGGAAKRRARRDSALSGSESEGR